MFHDRTEPTNGIEKVTTDSEKVASALAMDSMRHCWQWQAGMPKARQCCNILVNGASTQMEMATQSDCVLSFRKGDVVTILTNIGRRTVLLS
ncbi:uncharacterized protein C8Q71DRAFT_862156 [Rhodofomes roseus]|uniref:Uncharacterized protein n=1 Tax=Rhodofomes roseus TaxID=34475 RepID=A0ABQ8K2Q6_9APHY|nr:uncharacterized protein C8Q71DRAFT_862156 [Rhodofomes roseus]KAH9831026.1 hypothetical protein C8Q71DRAFT_862156 [Rhodofomes roseus]